MKYQNRRVAVWGAARSGIAVSNLLARLGARVYLSDSRDVGDLKLDELDSTVKVTGGNVLGDAEIVVPSPGIPPSHQLFETVKKRGIQLLSEIEIAASVAVAPVVAITGTDGKTTTTEMTAAAIAACGRRPIVGGNIGTPFSAQVLDASADDVLVIEVSAFQLWSTSFFAPQVAVLTNIAGDHADYFDDDVDAYISAKLRLLRDMAGGTTAVMKGDDKILARVEPPQGVRKVNFQAVPTVDGWGYRDRWITDSDEPVMNDSELQVSGVHNVCNAQAALAAGVALGLNRENLAQGLANFTGLPHRVELVRTRRGVRWINDSKATNPHAAAAGLRAQSGRMIVITGGFDKGLDLTPFFDAIDEAKHIIATGDRAKDSG